MQELVVERKQSNKSFQAIPAMPAWLKEEILKECEGIWQRAYEALEQFSHLGQEQALETMVRDRMLGIGAKLLEGVMSCAWGKGYSGAQLACSRCGQMARFVGHRARKIITLLGRIKLDRAYYHCRNCRKGLVPLDGKLLASCGGFSAGALSAVCRAAASASFEDARKLLKDLAGLSCDKKTIRLVSEKKGRELERFAQREIQQFWKHPKYCPRESSQNPRRLYAMADGAMVHIVQEGWKEVKVGAVFSSDIPIKGQRPKRLGPTVYAAALEDSKAFGKRFYVEAAKQGIQETGQAVAVADGAPWIWNEVEEHFPPNRTEILDFYHSSDKLHAAGEAAFGEGSAKAVVWGEHWKKRMKKGETKQVLGALRRLKPKGMKSKQTLRQTIDYIKGNKHRMDYGRLRRQGYFIGSGVVESACKNVVAQRMKGPGMRWKRKGAQALLQLRVTHLNNRWEMLWIQ